MPNPNPTPTLTLILNHYQNRTFVLLGLGREGLSTYNFLRNYFPNNQIIAFDEKNLADLNDEWKKIFTSDLNLTLNPKPSLNPTHNVITFKSPGVSPHSEFYTQVVTQFENPEITSNTNLFFELMKDKATIIGVTGTKGKSTTTSAIYHVLSSGYRVQGTGRSNVTDKTLTSDPRSLLPVYLGGNIGVPPLDLIPNLTLNPKPIVVLELSSHQLLNLQHSPHIAVIQEIVPEHLDYYKTFEEYVAAKAQITKFQTSEDTVIFNSDYEIPTNIAQQSPGKLIDISTGHRAQGTGYSDTTDNPLVPDPRSLSPKYNKHFSIIENSIYYKNDEIIDSRDLQIKGEHNILNILPAIVIAKLLNCSTASIQEALKTFKPLKHRLELVNEINGVQYYNDSLATTPEACIAALQAFPQQNIVLIAGGYDRHLDYSTLAEEILDRNVKALVLFKPTGELIASALNIKAQGTGYSDTTDNPLIPDPRSLPPIRFVETMQEAVSLASSFANSGDVVLMSPASASFGRFKDYADRGEQFRKAVESIKKGQYE